MLSQDRGDHASSLLSRCKVRQRTRSDCAAGGFWGIGAWETGSKVPYTESMRRPLQGIVEKNRREE